MKKIKYTKNILAILCISLLFGGCIKEDPGSPYIGDKNVNLNPDKDTNIIVTNPNPPPKEEDTNNDNSNSSEMVVTFLDVGQAHCEVIQTENGVIMIDGGNREDADLILSFLEENDIHNIDVMIATHPHEDHIGALPDVLEYCTVEELYVPFIPEQYEPTTVIYSDLMDTAADRGAEIIYPITGDIIYEEENGIQLEVLFDGATQSDDMNDYSIITMLTNQEDSFIFPGDANHASELTILDNWVYNPEELKTDVLLVGHHGSHTSSCREWLAALKPEYAVISCGLDNSYGHPHQEVLTRLKLVNAKVLNTIDTGTVVFQSTGTGVTLKSQEKGN